MAGHADGRAKAGGGGNNLTPAKILGWQAQPSVFERFEAYAPRQFDVTGEAEPERVNGLIVSTDFCRCWACSRASGGHSPMTTGGQGQSGSRFLEALLFEVRPADPVSFLSATAILIVVALVACWLPTRAAMRVHPAVALRVD